MGKLKRERSGASERAHANLWCARQDDSLLELLNRRYARGEITRERCEEVRRWMGVSDAGARVRLPPRPSDRMPLGREFTQKASPTGFS